MSPPFPLSPFLNERLRFHTSPPNIVLQIRHIRFIPDPPSPNLPRQSLQEAKHATLGHHVDIIVPLPTFPPPDPPAPITHPPVLPGLRRLVPVQQPIQLVIPPLALVLLPIVVEVKREVLPPAAPPAVLGLALALLAEVVAHGEAGLAGRFEAGAQGGEAGGDVVLGEVEEGGLGREVGGLDVLGDLVEGLADAGVGGPHGVGSRWAVLVHRCGGGVYAIGSAGIA